MPPARQVPRRPVRTPAQRVVSAPARTARAVTVRKGGQHALMAEFLLFLGIVGMRAVADFVPGDKGQPTEGTAKGTIIPGAAAQATAQAQGLDPQQAAAAAQASAAQLGPLPILAAGFAVFFILSFMAARGGAWAKVAAISGLIIDVALLMKSLPELNTVSQGFTNATAGQSAGLAGLQAIAQQQAANIPPTPGGTINPATQPGIAYTQVPDATGLFPIITPNVPPVSQGAGQNPDVFTQP